MGWAENIVCFEPLDRAAQEEGREEEGGRREGRREWEARGEGKGRLICYFGSRALVE